MKYLLSQSFVFEAAHSLCREIDKDTSLRIHGHSYQVTVTLCGETKQESGMLMDLGRVKHHLEQIRLRLDHHLLDHIEGLGPATLENLCSFVWQHLRHDLAPIYAIKVARPLTGDACELLIG